MTTQPNTTPLTVYRASAGSGKTFRLAVEYIKLVVRDPESYKRILAVTFTNKATEEMKMRILSQLYGIANRLDDSDSYLQKVVDELHMPQETVIQNAGLALRNLLHNYNYFRVETIDSFFQSVLRNLARELNLTANLRIELNDQQIEQDAVDVMIDNLNQGNDVLRWVIDFIKQRMAENEGWNVISSIKTFGKNLLKDDYKANREQLEAVFRDENFFEKFSQQLEDASDKAKKKIEQQIEQFNSVMTANDLSAESFSGGKNGVCGYFKKLSNKQYGDDILNATTLKHMSGADTWIRKTDKKGQALLPLISSTLLPLLNKTEEIRKKEGRVLRSVKLTKANLNELRLLRSIEATIIDMNNQANRFLLSDTQQLLNKLIDKSDSPFVFEKIGSQIDHIMIDEFQDTSTIQWKNFKVLLEECMSRRGSHNLIVGDVKQSIYRWRSGDWRLLNNIEEEMQRDGQHVTIDQLDTNYRSCRRVINFNNRFFQHLAAYEYNSLLDTCGDEALQLQNAYADLAQKVPDSKPDEGFVQIMLLPKAEYETTMLDQTLSTVQQLITSGAAENDIAIIVRRNTEIQAIANHFMQHAPNIKLVSNEAFRLDASPAVSILVEALRFLACPADNIAKANLMKAYQLYICGNNTDDGQLFMHEPLTDLLPANFVQQQQRLISMPLHDMAQKLYAIFSLNKLEQQSAYVCAFFDCLNKFMADYPADISLFIEKWDETYHSSTIQSDEVNGIRMLTIHRSKGLEFEHVILPFCDWKLETSHKGDYTLWCKPPEVQPFCQLPLIPIPFSQKNMVGTIFEQDYNHEHLQNCVDNINLLYVAFTRAARNLFVFGKRDSSIGNRSKAIQTVLPDTANALNAQFDEATDDAEQPICMQYGELSFRQKVAKGATQNVLQQSAETVRLDVQTFPQYANFRQSNKSREYIMGDEADNQTSFIKLGTVLHNIFSTITTADDIPAALAQMETEGILYDDSTTSREDLQELIRCRLQDPKVAEWFSPHWRVFNERTILTTDSESGVTREYRPDRVITDGKQTIVIDFKFARMRQEHHDQVKHYMLLLQDMGHTNVSGALWYVYSNQIEYIK